MLVEVSAALVRQTKQPATAKQAAKNLYNSSVLIKEMDTQLMLVALEIASDLRLRAGDAIYVALAHQLAIPS